VYWFDYIIRVNKLADSASFEWDENKNSLNQRKHNISFEEAQYVFSDSKRIIAIDLEHNEDEDRFTVLVKLEKM